jgi:phosphate acetyltransferase
VKIISPIKSEHYEDYVNTYYELRKKKNVTLGMAKDLMEDGSYFGTMMVYTCRRNGFWSSPYDATYDLPALQFIKTKPNSSVVSSIFYVLRRPSFCFWDCA